MRASASISVLESRDWVNILSQWSILHDLIPTSSRPRQSGRLVVWFPTIQSSLPLAFVAFSPLESASPTFASPYQPRAPSLSDRMGWEK
jgi:hypothetical protein